MYEKYEKHQQHYFGCITALDEQVGQLRSRLRKLEVAKNTMLWFCSDNGPEGNERAPGSTGGLRGRKRSLFEGGVRVPGLLEWPARITEPSQTEIPACTSDYLPTILSVLDVSMKDNRPIDGVSLLPLIEGHMKLRPKPIAFESAGQRSLTDNRYKLVLPGSSKKNKNGKKSATMKYMLFDLIADPGEKNDLASEHPEIVTRMATVLEAWQESHRRSLAGHDY
jgi:arylsulfatase A-like enzyme